MWFQQDHNELQDLIEDMNLGSLILYSNRSTILMVMFYNIVHGFTCICKNMTLLGENKDLNLYGFIFNLLSIIEKDK